MKTKMYRMKLFVLLALFASSIASAQVNESVWQESYSLEYAGKYAQANVAIEAVLRESPNHEFALMRRAWLNYLQGRYNDALRDYNQVLSLNPRSLDARLGLTLPLIAQQRWREAEMEANKVISVSAWDYTANVRLMVCEEGERKWEGLSRHAGELAAHYPTDATVLVYLARAEAWQAHVKKARSAYAKVLERIPAHAEAAAYLKNNP